MAITTEQANTLLEFYIEQLQEKGFEDVVDQVNELFLRDEELQQLSNQPYRLLMFYISQTGRILQSMSNSNYQGILRKLNSSLTTEGEGITSLVIQGVGPERAEPFDLSDSPNYGNLIGLLEGIQAEIQRENE